MISRSTTNLSKLIGLPELYKSHYLALIFEILVIFYFAILTIFSLYLHIDGIIAGGREHAICQMLSPQKSI